MRVRAFCVSLILAAAPAVAPAAADDEFEKGFGKSTGMSEADTAEADDDRLKIGGSVWSELQYYSLDPDAAVDGLFVNPNSLWVYLDARLRGDVRAYVKYKLIYTPTVSPTAINPFTGEAGEELVTDLEEIKLLFNAGKTAFFTVGKQKLKWGSGKFWNPTDFVNAERRNFLYSQDIRSGLGLVKTHVPLGDSNFYLVQRLDGATQPEEIQHAARFEVPIAGTAEVAVSTLIRRGDGASLGVDVSTALWDFDVYGELAYPPSPGARDASWVAGLTYEMKAWENDSLSLSLEYFRNGTGVTETGLYPGILLAGDYQPFHLSREYGMVMVYLPEPGGWNDLSFMLYNILNLTDASAMTRFEAHVTALQDLTFVVGFGAHYGNRDGELKFGGQTVDVFTRLMASF